MGREKEYYKSKIDTILHHINRMILHDWSREAANSFNKATSIDRLATIGAISVRNLHIIFKAYTGEHVHQYINRLRLEYAKGMLKTDRYTNEIIAAYVGFSNVTAFYNAFKKQFGQTPVQFRKNALTQQVIPRSGRYPFNLSFTMRKIAETPVLFLSYAGNYDSYSSHLFEHESWDVLYQYAKEQNLLPMQEDYWGICYDDTSITNPDKCRFYACMTIHTPVKSKLVSHIKSMILPSRLYAVYLHKGSYSLLDSFYDGILKNLPQDYLLGDGFILEHYLNSPQDTPEHELLTEVLLPVEPYK